MSKLAPIVAANATIALVNIPMLQGRTAAASVKFGKRPGHSLARRHPAIREYAVSAIQVKLPEQSK
ncbi:hypothetical protein [Nitrobacter sp.]|jgi:hypothetical protein|uniref:hypothetical protein n=1 Tax=Nitrobacter sp. TaxID=29420 RepID=UPI0029CAAF57|nr:hypothetical protein [Nitrobacter sp.]